MEERVYVDWTIVNWITVFLMATMGFLVLGLIAQAAHTMMGNAGRNGDGQSAS